MKIIGINASPRKKANTQTLVETILEGAAEKGAETRMVHLRELNIKWLNVIPLSLGSEHYAFFH